jgi:colicin import membrane protein
MNTIGVQICRGFCRLALAGMVNVMVGCAQTGTRYFTPDSGTAAESIAARYHEGSIQSVEAADQALAEVRSAREKITPQFAAEERACYDRFFTNLCLDDVEERKRSAMQQLRRVEVEANAFKRRDKVERRDDRKAQREKRLLPFPGDGDPDSPQSPQGVQP